MSASGASGAVVTEAMSRQELVATISKQNEQLKRYETRLRDVVTAYKGLVKQKEALETSLNALNRNKHNVEATSQEDDSVSALTLSLSTLTVEKSRMEEAFQADKRITKEKYEKIIQDLKEEIQNEKQQHRAEVNNLKAKITFEMQEREKERADHSAIIKELHNKFNSVRKSKDKLEDKFSISTDAQATNIDLEKRVRDLSKELEAAQRRLGRAEARSVETPQMLVRLQQKMALLEQSHSAAITQEQIKVRRAEETARKVCASQEERVAVLEGKLAELSRTVGEYSARATRDQLLIRQLRETLNAKILQQSSGSSNNTESKPSETDNEKLADTEYLQNLIEKIHILKQELISENAKLGSPVDVSAIFATQNENIHARCRQDLENLSSEFELYKRQLAQNNPPTVGEQVEVDRLVARVESLRDMVDSLTAQLHEERRERGEAMREKQEELISEQKYHKEVTSELRSRIVSLEKQLSVQRERYSVLLEETDHYIRASNDRSRKHSSEDGPLKENLQECAPPPHMLHYVHELARKDLDITQLRKDKHHLEAALRDTQRDSTIDKERMKEVVRNLKQEIDRLRRIQSREGANLEYLKNVVLSYLTCGDYAGRRHMLNAIAAVLHFTDLEKNTVHAVL